jgi:transcriptional regulator with XRE-family HTH domain
MADTPISDTLLRAATRFGSSQMLARYLRVDHDELRQWMRGENMPSDAILARAAQVLEAADLEPINVRGRSR